MSQQRIVVANWEENNCNVKRTALVLGLNPSTVSRHLRNAGVIEPRKPKDDDPIGRTVNDKAITTATNSGSEDKKHDPLADRLRTHHPQLEQEQ